MPRPIPPEATVKQARDMYRMGYRQAMTDLYTDNDPARIAYGLDYYSRRGTMKHGEYERGIADALEERISATRKEQ